MVYLIHFDIAFSHARHYLGYTDNLLIRMDQHKKGNGSRLMAAVELAGIGWQVVKVWPEGTRTLERQLKRQKNGPRFCPICNPRKDT